MPAKSELNIIIKGKDMASKSIGSITKALGGLGKATAIGTGAVVAGGALAGAALFKLAEGAAPIEGIQKAFEGLTEGMEGGTDQMLRALAEGSLGMVSNTELMRGFNEAAQLVGVDFAERLPDAMGVLAKVSAATGQDMDYLLSSMTIGVGKLSPMILDNLNIQVDATAAYQDWADKMGVAVESMSKTEQQAALMDQVMVKLAANTAKMPDITENASTKMAQFKTTMANAKDQIGTALLPMFTKLMGAVGKFAAEHLPGLIAGFRDQVVPFIEEKVVPILTTLWNWISANLPGAIETISGFVSGTLIPAFSSIWNYLVDNVFPKLEDLKAWLDVTIPAAFEFLKGVWETVLKPGLKDLKGFVQDTLIPVISDLFDWLNVSIPDAFKIVEGVWNNVLKPVLTALWEFVRDNVLPIIKDVWDWLAIQIPNAFGTIKTFWIDTLRPTLDKIWKFIDENVIPVFESIFKWLDEKIPDVMEDLGRWWDNTGGPIWDKVRIGVSAVVDAIQNVIDLVAKAKRAIEDLLGMNITLPGGIELGFGGGIPNRGPGRQALMPLRFFLDELIKKLEQASGGLEGFFGIMSGLGSTAAAQLEKTRLEPLAARIAEINEVLASPETSYFAFSSLLEERNQLEQEYADIQATIARQEEERSRFGFLQQQFELLRFIRDYKLDVSEVLGGIGLGAGASFEGILEATTRALSAVNAQLSGHLASQGLWGQGPMLAGTPITVAGDIFIGNVEDMAGFIEQLEEAVV